MNFQIQRPIVWVTKRENEKRHTSSLSLCGLKRLETKKTPYILLEKKKMKHQFYTKEQESQWFQIS